MSGSLNSYHAQENRASRARDGFQRNLKLSLLRLLILAALPRGTAHHEIGSCSCKNHAIKVWKQKSKLQAIKVFKIMAPKHISSDFSNMCGTFLAITHRRIRVHFLSIGVFKEYASKSLLPKKFPAQKPGSPIIASNFPSHCYRAHQTKVYPIVQLNSK